MKIAPMPGCCTSSILFSLGEHGEPSEVSVEKINELCATQSRPMTVFNGRGVGEIEKCIFAISVDPDNQALLLEAGFHEVSHYQGIQGVVRIYVRGAA